MSGDCFRSEEFEIGLTWNRIGLSRVSAAIVSDP